MSDQPATCSTCRFCAEGLCRRYPPIMVPWPHDNQHPVIYEPAPTLPMVSQTDWCGEHQPKGERPWRKAADEDRR